MDQVLLYTTLQVNSLPPRSIQSNTPHPPIDTGTGHYSVTEFLTYTGSYPTGYVPSFLGPILCFRFSLLPEKFRITIFDA